MKKLSILLALAMVGTLCRPLPVHADDGIYPKHEMRAAWVATVSNMDFPHSGRGTTEAVATNQKAEIVKYLDAMKDMGVNCIFFHARPMADRLYARNTYGDVTVDEPWSEYLTGKRGNAPAYDPMEVWIDEAHKRGMEIHAWLNPYRYANSSSSSASSDTYNPYTTDHDKQVFESGWLIRRTASSGVTYIVFNPALERTTQLICDVCTVLAGNYDLDGILFDDYFYPDGIANNSTAPDYANYTEYKNNGGTLSLLDWRRDNVNRMVAAVYSTIKSVKPWMRFGISPAGAAGKGLKSEDGLPALSSYCPANDWQYDGIASDPIAWLREKTVDYVSPQLYWKTTHSTNPFGPMARWWAKVCNKFGRHLFVSNNLDKVVASPSNSNYTSPEELCKQITLQRQATGEYGDYPGIVFFPASYVDGYYPNDFPAAAKETNFSRQAILPPLEWQQGYNPGLVTNISRYGDQLVWTGYDNVRYTVYAVPESVPQQNFDGNPDYLLGFTYTASYEIPENRRSGYNYAVCVYDRFGYEHSARFMGVQDLTLPAPVAVSPADGAYADLPFSFSWTAVEGAAGYTLEIAGDAAFTDFVAMKQVSTTECPAETIENLPAEQTLYWRVHAYAPNYNDGVSAPRSFKVRKLAVTSPAEGDVNVSLQPVITWNATRQVKLQLATNANFTDASMALEATVTAASYAVPRYRLAGNTKYWCRLLYNLEAETPIESEVVSFTTVGATPTTTSISYPAPGGELFSNEHVAITPVDGASLLRLEVCADPAFAPRSSYITTDVHTDTWADPKTGEEIRISLQPLADGGTYYARCKAYFRNESGGNIDGGYSEAVQFTYRAATGLEDIELPADADYDVYDLSGRHVATDVHALDSGRYILRTRNSNVSKKIVIR